MLRKITATLLMLLSFAAVSWAANKIFTLVIDAGHGGHDFGAPGAISNEKDINLRVALAFGKYVESNCPDVKVIYTRKTDVFVPLKERANTANRNKADLFISVHTNALEGGKIARGFETYTLGMHRAKDNLDVAMRENSVIVQEKNYQQTYQGFDPKSSESYIIFELMQGAYMERSVDLAKMIQKSVCSTANRPNKGVHQAGFLVLRETSMPSCLIELGFITTPDEEQQLNDASQVDLIAQGIYKAFLQYKDKYDKGGIATLSDSDAATTNSDQVITATDAVAQPQKTVPMKRTVSATVNSNDTPVLAKQSNMSTLSSQTRQKKQVAQKSLTAQKNQKSLTAQSNQTALKDQKSQKNLKNQKNQNSQTNPTGQTSQKNQISPTSQKSPKSQKNQPATKDSKKAVNAPVFKVQIFAGSHKLRFNDPRFKGLQGCDSFDDGKMIRYTYGSSTNYNEINRLRKQILDKFPDAFIIALKNGKVMDVNEAIKEFLDNKKQK